jgi:transcriptional regulator with XRE-family HTH domain
MDTAESLPKIVMSENLPAELAKIAQEYGSISALARRLGLDRSNLHKVIQGKRPPSPALLSQLDIRKRIAYLTLPPLEAAGFLLHRERPAVAGLTLAPQAFNLSVCPTARRILIPSSLMFFAAL